MAPSCITDMSRPRNRVAISSIILLASAAPAPEASYRASKDASVAWVEDATFAISDPS